ncbi:DNA-binding transcriptional regulator [Sedimentisphaera salicampi]|uniref:Xylose operon regulatory protein n=1 Tax=Sedimentisphaera salicampi TaxID=1941349 RepID=A0A1W6LP39_9BACT|nr:DNA-binding transcriptional regulator [Sedimentisphaera salicampi]ARN57516.1 Xylose operon regulatory protein [Sedimentisphaera salicampi]OXU14378.1 Xylose operon regulatory protein [Sedimentisphaera salicampi]
MRRKKKILLVINRTKSNGRELLRGIVQYGKKKDYLEFTVIDSENSLYLNRKQFEECVMEAADDAQGIIMVELTCLDKVKKLNKPIVHSYVYNSQIEDKYTITTDPVTVSRAAYEHLRTMGNINFAYIGYKGVVWADERRSCFEKSLPAEKRPLKYLYYKQPKSTGITTKSLEKIADWLKTLPIPTGIMACNDNCGADLISACKKAELDVPDDISVVAVDNDDLVCDFTSPTLSSIDLDTDSAGYEAAELIDKITETRKIPPRMIRVKPREVVIRQSTDFVAVEDRDVAAALRFIRLNSDRPILVQEVCDFSCCSRQYLHRKFMNALGKSVHKCIKRARVKAITTLLLETTLPVTEIAYMLNFPDSNHISKYFKDYVGLTPKEYRHKYQPLGTEKFDDLD